ncbi:hypothetical protein [Lentibacillus juripiscarius]|uniref:hypothetical protein n=1 Tax=Lentibacillus juripiscarius TaxID=257446 RepID=UPI0036D3D14B
MLLGAYTSKRYGSSCLLWSFVCPNTDQHDDREAGSAREPSAAVPERENLVDLRNATAS